MLLLRRKGSVSRLVSYIYKWFLLLPVEDRVILGDLNLVDLFLAFQICFSAFVVNYSSPNSGWITLLCAVLCETCFVPPLQPVMAECPTYVCVSDVNLAPEKQFWCNTVCSACAYGQHIFTTTKYQEVIVRLNKTATTVGVVHLILVF